MIGARVGFFSSTLHAEAADWRARVVAAGGNVSGTTLAAVSKFCTDIDTAGIRSRFYRLNLMCGDFTGCLIPLYRATSFVGSVLGSTSDTNNNFVSQDYNETGSSTGGLKGNGSTKYLATGYNPSTASASETNFHLSIYAKGTEASGTSRAFIGNRLGTAAETFIGLTTSGQVESAGVSCQTSERVTAPSGTKEGLMLVTTNGSRSQTYYLNGTASTSVNASANGPFASAGIDVFRASTFYSLARYIRAYSIGLGLSSTQEASFRSALVTFQTSLTRNV
jgi:hypothetical protein